MNACVFVLSVLVALVPVIVSRGVGLHGMTCSSGSDCPGDSCCLFQRGQGVGVCKPMRRIAWDCYTRQPYAWAKPDGVVKGFDLCPCDTGSFCVPTGKVHPLYGGTGICTFG